MIANEDPLELAAGVAALQLIPANAGTLLRLETLAAMISLERTSSRKPRPISPSRLAKMVRHPDLAGTIQGEDPFNHLFTEAFRFTGGTYIVFPGLSDETSFIFRHVCRALFLSHPPIGDADFQTWASRLVHSTLLLIDAVAKRAGLKRGATAGNSKKNAPIVPQNKEFALLKAAARFTASELDALFMPNGYGPADFCNLIARLGLAVPPPNDPLEPSVVRRPIVQIGDDIVVLCPGNVVTALRHLLISEGVNRGYDRDLAQSYQHSVFDDVRTSLERMNWECVRERQSKTPGSFVEGLFSFDRDKVAHVVLATDPFEEWDADTVTGAWDDPTLVPNIYGAMAKADGFMFNKVTGITKSMHLLLVQGVGRGSFFGFDGPARPDRSFIKVMSAADLEAISLLDKVDQLTLWQFVQASRRFRDRASVMCFGVLDEFAFYRSHQCGYYLTDDGRPDLLTILPDCARELHEKIQARWDWHAVHSPIDESILDVISWHADSRVPIYCRPPDSPGPFMLLVEGLSLPLWVLAPDIGDQRYEEPYIQIADMVSYWLWKLTPALADLLERASEEAARVILEVHLVPGQQWHAPSDMELADETLSCEGLDCERLRFSLGAGCFQRLATPDNSGERKIMSEILNGFRTWGLKNGRAGVAAESNDSVDTMIDLYMPLGQQKKLIAHGTDRHPELDPRGLPTPYRPIQDFDGQAILDDIGDFLTGQQKLNKGDVPPGDRVRVLNDIVGYLYRQLQDEVATLSPDGLLEYLVAFNERLVYTQEHRRMTTPTWIACFGSMSEMVDRMRNEMPEAATAAIASRFLIEYVAARPPKGEAVLSMATYDRLLAIAGEIVGLGNTSDAIKYDLADRSCRILGSGRLGIGRSRFEEAMDNYQGAYVVSEIGRREDRFQSYWASGGGDVNPEYRRLHDAVDQAGVHEFGHTVIELNQFIHALIELRTADGAGPHVESMAVLVGELSESLGWDRAKVIAVVELFVLRERPDYLVPPAGYQNADIWPWRFNRGLSYSRKPLIARSTSKGDELIWGVRHLSVARKHLNDLCFGGKLKANSWKCDGLSGLCTATMASNSMMQ